MIIDLICHIDLFVVLTFAIFQRMSRALANIGFAANTSHRMQHRFEKLVCLSNGGRPIDGAYLARRSDLA
jgi:hypothetical protein